MILLYTEKLKLITKASPYLVRVLLFDSVLSWRVHDLIGVAQSSYKVDKL